MNLRALFDQIATPVPSAERMPCFAVREIPGYSRYLLGKNRDGHPSLLVEARCSSNRQPSPIRLNELGVRFCTPCCLIRADKGSDRAQYTIIECRSNNLVTANYFLTVCETLAKILGTEPDIRALGSCVTRLASIFQRLQGPPSRTIIGLFGELFIIWMSSDPIETLSCWHADPTSRFDFMNGDVRLEVKVTTRRGRVHTFSYEQCNPPPGTMAVVASIIVERTNGGLSLQQMVTDISAKIGDHFDLLFKLQTVIAETLGNQMDEGLREGFDKELAEHTLRFYDVSEIPAVRGDLEVGVSDVHFSSDLGGCTAVSRSALIYVSDRWNHFLPPNYRGID